MKIIIKKKRWTLQKYHFTIIAVNDKVIAQSENYYNLNDALDTAILIRGLNSYAIVLPDGDMV
jgi:uncharacterized protein YegP (UPF0339 family)